MARDQVAIECPAGEWTELTNANVATITFQCLRAAGYVRYTVGSVDPGTGEEFGQLANTGEGPLQKNLTELTYLATANRVWVRPAGSAKCVFLVDHI